MLPGLKSYQFQILLEPDEDGTVSAIVLNLPGAGSCGESEDEAIRNVQEAIRGVLDEYRSSGECIPWQDTTGVVIPDGARTQWITVDV